MPMLPALNGSDQNMQKFLKKNSNGKTDYLNRPSEDFARSLIEYKDESNQKLVVETTTSWCFVGAGLRLSMELFGPEYSMFVNTLDSDLKVFLVGKWLVLREKT